MSDPSGIAVELFKSISEYCDEINSGDRSIDDALGKNNALVLFAENFLAQFSRRHLPKQLIGLNDRSARQLVSQRKRLEASGTKPQMQRLMYKFEELCSQVGEVSYSTSDEEAEQFHLEYFPAFMDVVIDWLVEVCAETPLTDAAADTQFNYNQAVGL